MSRMSVMSVHSKMENVLRVDHHVHCDNIYFHLFI